MPVPVTVAFFAVSSVVAFTTPTTALAASTVPHSTSVQGLPVVGTLFTTTKSGGLGNHFCTGSVIDSPAGDLILTAAHCISNRSASSFVFVPEYRNGKTPLGVWQVSNVFVDSAWTSTNDNNDDFAFLTVHQAGNSRPIQQLTGAEHLGIKLPANQLATVVGYPDTGSEPISCESLVFLYDPTQLQFDCDGYTNGTSGSPFVVDLNSSTNLGTVVGVIGGYQQGGLTPSVSYASRFETNMTALYKTASAA